MIQLTNTWLPNKEKFISYLDRIYENGIVTNNGSLVKEFEQRITTTLKVNRTLYVNSGHTALMMAIRTLKSKGKIITTPFSFISTLQAILWNNHQPIFADIEKDTLSIDPNRVEDILKKGQKVKAIVATHLFGNICDIEGLQYLSEKYGISVIYDAAHSFGIQYKDKSIFEYGDISAVSFQTYKALHSVEGGALFTKDTQIFEELFNMRYFGIDLDGEIQNIGLNGKNSEIHAAFGLCSLDSWNERLEKRQKTYHIYHKLFSVQSNWEIPKHREGIHSNYSYFPIICQNVVERKSLENFLSKNDIQSKRYFTPALNTIQRFGISYQEMPIAESIAERILCIPIHSELSDMDIRVIIAIFEKFLSIS